MIKELTEKNGIVTDELRVLRTKYEREIEKLKNKLEK